MARYTTLPWGEIRDTWETTNIGMEKLAQHYGIRSITTLKRRRIAEGWVRRDDLVDARTLLEDVGPDRVEEILESAQARRLPAVIRIDGLRGADPAERVLRMRPTVNEALAGQTEHQLMLAREVQLTGLLVLQRLQAILLPSGEGAGDEARMLRNLHRLIRVNPERETLAGLVTMAAKAVDIGSTMERRALTPDNTKTQVNADTAPGAASDMAREFISRLDFDTTQKVRAFAIEIQQKQRTLDIEAVTTATAN